jgi:tryptophan synthase beta chain
MPALETAHGIAYVKKVAPTMNANQSIVVNVSGRGDKDINTVASIEGIEL